MYGGVTASALADLACTEARLSGGQPGAGRENVLVVHDAVLWIRIEVARVRPDRVRGGTRVDRQTAVVAVKAALDAVRRREDRREDPEVVGRPTAPTAGQHIVGVAGPHTGLTRGARTHIHDSR